MLSHVMSFNHTITETNNGKEMAPHYRICTSSDNNWLQCVCWTTCLLCLYIVWGIGLYAIMSIDVDVSILFKMIAVTWVVESGQMPSICRQQDVTVFLQAAFKRYSKAVFSRQGTQLIPVGPTEKKMSMWSLLNPFQHELAPSLLFLQSGPSHVSHSDSSKISHKLSLKLWS